jgi:zinc protease
MRELLGGGAAPLGVSAPRRPAATPAPAAPPRLEREEAQVRVYRSASGLPILVRRKRGAPMVHLGVYAAGGAVNEPNDEAGLTTLLARTMLKGTARRDATQIAEDAEMLGGSIGVGAGVESVGWSISVPAKHARAALDLLADVVQHATIPETALETERLIAIADVRMLRDDMYRYPVRLATRAAFRDHPYGIPVSGTEESLGRLSLDRVRAWHRARVLEAPAVLAVVGDVEPDDIAAAAGRCFTALGTGERPPLAEPSWPGAATAAVEPRDKAQTALAMLFPAPSRLDDDRYAAHLIAGIASGLGGRFFDELRDRRSLAYTVHAFATERRLAGTFVAYIATSPEREEEARRGLLAEFAKLRETPVTEEELQRAKTYAIGTHAIRQQSAASVLGDVVDAWLYGRSLAELEEFEARVTAVTRENIQTLARRYFDESRRVEGIVRGVGRAV